MIQKIRNILDNLELLVYIVLVILTLYGIILICAKIPTIINESRLVVNEHTQDLTLNEDGSITVHETWEVNAKHEITEFVKDLGLPHDELQSYSEIVPISFKINGKECTKYNRSANPNYQYSLSRVVREISYEEDVRRIPKFEFTWFGKCEGITKYEATYDIKGAIKNVEDEYAGLMYKIYSDDYKIHTLKVNVKTYNNGNVTIDNNDASLQRKNVTNDISFSIKSDLDYFDNLEFVNKPNMLVSGLAFVFTLVLSLINICAICSIILTITLGIVEIIKK